MKHPWHWSGLLLGLLLATRAAALESYSYQVVDQRPLPRDNFVQGLEFDGETLLVGSGLYGQSRLRRYAFPSMELLDERRLPPHLFGEGVTRFGDYLFQLTWRSRTGIRYRASNLAPLGRFTLPGEGWGLTHNADALIYSDGSARLRFLDPGTLQQRRELLVTRRGRPLPRLNELEWIEGRIWANVWTSDQVVIINPDSGVVEGEIDLSGLLPRHERQPGTDVLNGIARDPASGAIWVTGKRWPWLYRIELRPTASPQ